MKYANFLHVKILNIVKYFFHKNWEFIEDFLGMNGPIWVLPL